MRSGGLRVRTPSAGTLYLHLGLGEEIGKLGVPLALNIDAGRHERDQRRHQDGDQEQQAQRRRSAPPGGRGAFAARPGLGQPLVQKG
ncbi:MAG: hypothetical protein C4310_12975 [Chloroflexota bacterium]